jgi:hypothetical protein
MVAGVERGVVFECINNAGCSCFVKIRRRCD